MLALLGATKEKRRRKLLSGRQHSMLHFFKENSTLKHDSLLLDTLFVSGRIHTAADYVLTPHAVVVGVVVVSAKFQNGITFERLEIST